MKSIAEGLVLIAAHFKAHASRTLGADEVFEELSRILRRAGGAEADSLATAAKSALVRELTKGDQADPGRIEAYRGWMHLFVDASIAEPIWSGNDRVDQTAHAVAKFAAAHGDRYDRLDGLLHHADDRRVFVLLLGIIADRREDPYVRTKTIRHFSYSFIKDAADQDRLSAALLGVLQGREDSLVRDYAVIALTQYVDHSEVEAALVPIMADPRENAEVRAAVLQSLIRLPHTRERLELFTHLADDSYLGEQVRTWLRLREIREG